MEVKKYSKYKLILFVIIFILSVFFSGFFTAKNVYAAELYPDTSRFDSCHWAILKRKSDGYIILISTFGDEEIVVIDDKFDNAYMKFKPKNIIEDYVSMRTIDQYYISRDGLTWEYGYNNYSENVDDYIILETNKDIKFNRSGDVFFSAINPKIRVTQEGMSQALVQLLSLLPVMMTLTVGFLGLRKALRALLAILRQA